MDQAIVRGSEHLKQSRIDQAVRSFQQALEIDPGNTRVLALLGLAYFRGGQFGEARPIYEQLVERAPTDASHRLNLGLVYLKLGDGDRALTALEASRALDPSQGRAVSYLGLAYARAGRYAEAYRSFLLAGQVDLAKEIEINLTPAERDGIHSQLGRPQSSAAVPPPPPGAAAAKPPPLPRPPTHQPVPAPAEDQRPPAPIPPTPSAPLSTPESVMRQMPTPPPAPTTAPIPPPPPPAAVALPLPAAPASAAPAPTPNRHSSPTAPIVPQPGAGTAVSRTVSQRAITQNVVSRAVLEESGSRPKTDPRLGLSAHLRPAARAPDPDSDFHDLPTPIPKADVSAPEIMISRSGQDEPGRVTTEDGADGAAIISIGPPPRMTESQQFVMASREAAAAVPQPAAGRSMVSTAVAAAAPAAPGQPRTAAGGRPPRPLSELATDELVRPDEGEDRIEIGPNGNLVIRVVDRMLVRLEGVHVTGGDLTYEPATRRTRGHQTEERFDHGGALLHVVSGRGYLIAMPGKHEFEAVALDDDILYLREDLVFAFEASLRWENGNVPGLRGKLPVVQFRGDGVLAMRTARPLVRVKLPQQGLLFVDAERLAGWIGRVIPRAVVPPTGGPMGAMCVECTGEGVVLVEPAPEPRRAAPPPPPPMQPQEIGPEDYVSEQEARPAMPPELADLGDDDRF